MQLKIKVAPTFLLFRDGDKVRQRRAVSRLSNVCGGLFVRSTSRAGLPEPLVSFGEAAAGHAGSVCMGEGTV